MAKQSDAPTKAAKQAQLEALNLLREEFSAESGRFKAGSSDKSIADVAGLSVDAVTTLREEWFGPLKEPAEIAELRVMIAKAEQALASIQGRFEKLCKELGV